MTDKNKLVELAREGAMGLARVRDEINVRIHLAGMEARDSWSTLQGRVHGVEQKLQHLGERVATLSDQAEVQFHLGVLEAQERWAALESQVARVLDEIERGAAAAKSAVEQGRVRAHLARLDAEEEIEPLLQRVRARFEALGGAAGGESASALGRLVEAVRALGARLGIDDRREPGAS